MSTVGFFILSFLLAVKLSLDPTTKFCSSYCWEGNLTATTSLHSLLLSLGLKPLGLNKSVEYNIGLKSMYFPGSFHLELRDVLGSVYDV